MSTQTRITIDRLKIAAFASEETFCFSARVLLDGRPFAMASNQGHGGCTDIRPLPKSGNPAAFEVAEAYCKSLPIINTEFHDKDGQPFSYQPDLEHVVDDLVGEAELDKRVRASYNRTIKKYICYAHDGVMYQYKRAAFPTAEAVAALCEQIHAKKPGAAILDMLPSGNAYDLYKRLTVKG